MKKISLASWRLLAVIAIAVMFIASAVSAETILDEELIEWEDTGGTRSISNTPIPSKSSPLNSIHFANIENHPDTKYIIVTTAGNKAPEGTYDITYTLNGQARPATKHVIHHRNLLGTVTSTRFEIFFDDWDIGSLVGHKYITLSDPLFTVGTRDSGGYVSQDLVWLVAENTRQESLTYTITLVSVKEWKNHLTVNDYPINAYEILLERVIDSKSYASTITLLHDGDIQYSNGNSENINLVYLKNEINAITLNSGVKTYTWDLTNFAPGEPDNSSVTVYVRNSQTGAAIANSRIVIDALVDGDYYPVVNRTEPSGIFSVTLQPTGGGSPNPDGYRLIASADGYNNPMPEINFTVDEYTTSIYCSLDPITGGPVDENNTFIDFFVRDMSANPISGATVNFAGYTLLTNLQGYTVFEVGKNATYTYTISKSGYGSLTGNAVIGDDPRHTINTVLAPAVTPTKPTPIPTSTSITPNPTMTAPSGEPVSNWLEWFAAHFGMILGGGVEIGKIFMWLCFSVPVGVYVGKESKAGAAGFVAGAGIVTLFFVLIGWVPIWLLVLLALIIGLLYSKVFNNSDNGGGR